MAGAALGPGSIFTAKGGFIVGFLGTLGLETYKIEAGSTYLDLVDELNLVQGENDQVAKHIAKQNKAGVVFLYDNIFYL